MPQLNISTYPSQVFWLLVGFLIFYVLSTKCIVPSITNSINKRNAHLKDLADSTEVVKSEIHDIENQTLDVLENAIINIDNAEESEKSQIRTRGQEQRKQMYESYYEQIAKNEIELAKESSRAFSEMGNDIPTLVEEALRKLKENFESNNVS